MPFTNADRVKTTTTTTGTGTLTISTTAPTGFQNATAIGDGNSAPWCQTATSGEWQTFIGTVGASGTTLTKDIILDGSSGSGVAVSFPAGTKDVFCMLSANLVGYRQIGTTQTPSGVASSSITGIPTTYSDLLIEILGLSHDSGSNQSLRLELSGDNGATWTSPLSISAAAANTMTVYGGVQAGGYRKAAGSLFANTDNLASDLAVGAGNNNRVVWRIAAGINAVRLSFSGGNFDAGSWKLWGKL